MQAPDRVRALRISVLLLPLLLTLAAGPASGRRYPVRTYTQGDGLPNGTVMDVAQSSDGRMWFATRTGIVCYDGRTWKLYDTGDGLPVTDQHRVLIDPAGRIWAIGRDGETAVREDGVWHRLPPTPAWMSRPYNDFVAGFVSCGDSTTLWFGVLETGLARWSSGQWESITVPALGDVGVNHIRQHGGTTYLGTNDGTWIVDACVDPPSAMRMPGARTERTMRVLPCTDGSIWTVGGRFADRIREGEVVESVSLDFPLPRGYEYMAACQDGFGGIYITSPNQVVHYHPRTGLVKLDDQSGLTSVGATSALLDREGNVWLGTLRGISKIPSLCFVNYTSTEGLLQDEVSVVFQRRNGDIVLGHPNGLTLMKDDRPGRSIPISATTFSRVLDIAEQKDGTLWMAVAGRGLARLDDDGTLRFEPTDGGIDGECTSVFVDDEDNVWVTTGSQVFVNRGRGFTPSTSGPRALGSTNYLRRIFSGRHGQLYVAANDGLYELQGEHRHFHVNEGRRVNSIYSFLEGDDGTQWVGSAAGLYTIRDSIFVASTAPSMKGPIYFITRDPERRLWFGTDNGVAVWDDGRLRHIYHEDGLVGRETNRAAGIVDDQGRVWIGMDRGVSVYRPWFDRTPHGDPVITLLGVDVDGQPIETGRTIAQRGSSHIITFRYRVVSFVDEDRTRVQVRLEGYDDWLSTAGFEARYSRVPPGEYQFAVRAAGPGGEWKTAATTVPVRVLAPLHETTLFRVIIGLVILTIAYAVFLFVSNHRYARRLRREVDARVAELRTVEAELDRSRRIETIGVLAAGIAHDFNNLLAVIVGNLSLVRSDESLDEDTADALEDSLTASRRARALARQLLTFARGGAPVRRTGSMDALLRESASFLLAGSNVATELEIPSDLWAVEMDVDQMSQVVNNLLINAQQAMSDGGLITVRGRNHETSPHPTLPPGRYVEVAIHDAGTGIREEHIERIFDPYFTTRKHGNGLGLTTAYSIVSRHDGLLTVESTLGAGSVFRLYLPASDRTSGPEVTWETDMYRGTGSILVMDDEDGVRTVIERILTRAGYDVVLTSNGADAVEAYRERLEQGRRFDIIIMDLTVPGGMGGREALDRLRAIDPDVRAIVASGYSTDPVMSNHRKFGFVARVSKPFSISTLLRAVALTMTRDDPGRLSN